MDRERLASLTAIAGGVLLLGTAANHLRVYTWVVAQVPGEIGPLLAALWVAAGISLILAALVTFAAAPVTVVRRSTFLAIGALTPLSIAVLQMVYLGFFLPTAILLLDTAVVLAAAALGAGRRMPPNRAFAAGGS